MLSEILKSLLYFRATHISYLHISVIKRKLACICISTLLVCSHYPVLSWDQHRTSISQWTLVFLNCTVASSSRVHVIRFEREIKKKQFYGDGLPKCRWCRSEFVFSPNLFILGLCILNLGLWELGSFQNTCKWTHY